MQSLRYWKSELKTLTTRCFAQDVTMPNCSFLPKAYKDKQYDAAADIFKNNIRGHLLYFKKPLFITQGYKQWVFDNAGKRYLDMFAGIATTSVGHCHPKLVTAVVEQVQTLWHTSNIYIHPAICSYSEKLIKTMPEHLKVCFLLCSGSEANDLAVTLARVHTGNFDIVALRSSYHGGSQATVGLTGISKWKPHCANGFGIHHAMSPNVYTGIWGGAHCRDSPVQSTRTCACQSSNCEAADNYIKELEAVFLNSVNGNPAAFIAESIQGIGGIVQYPKSYLKKAFDLVKKYGGLYIADEVQTGLARTGENFWSFEKDNLKPDIVTLAKGIANGFPLSAVVTTPEIAQSFNKSLYLSTYGGNPMACVAASTVLDIIDEEKLQQNSLEVGTYTMQKLAEIRDQFEIVGDVRGKGLMIGVEFVKDKATREPLPMEDVMKILENCKDLGVLFGRGGFNNNVFRIQPPMCITKEDAQFAVDILRKALTNYQQGKLN